MKRLLFALGAKPASHCPETPGRSATWLWVGHRRESEALALAQAGTSDLPGPVTGASRVVPSETTDVSRAEKQLLKTTFGYFSEEIQNADSKEWMYPLFTAVPFTTASGAAQVPAADGWVQKRSYTQCNRTQPRQGTKPRHLRQRRRTNRAPCHVK